MRCVGGEERVACVWFVACVLRSVGSGVCVPGMAVFRGLVSAGFPAKVGAIAGPFCPVRGGSPDSVCGGSVRGVRAGGIVV